MRTGGIATSADPLRVLHVVPGLGLGGAETVLSRLVTGTTGISHEVICLGGPGWYSVVLEKAGIPVHHLGMDSVSIGGMMRIRQLIGQSRADVLQCWMYRANLVGGLVGRLSGIPTIWNIRASSLESLRLRSRLVAYAGGAATPWIPDYVINCSARSSELHSALGYARVPGSVIPNGYDPSLFFPDDAVGAKTREALGIRSDTFLIGTIGRAHPQKDIPNLLAALKIASQQGVQMKCLLVGIGLFGGNERLLQQIRDMGYEDIVLTLGQRSDVADLARAIDLHVLASAGEGFPNVVAETMLSGTVNAVTDVGDAALIVGDTGWVVPPRDPQRLARSIENAYNEWRSSPEQWNRRRNMALERIAENFSLDRMIDAYETVWRRCAKKTAPAAIRSTTF
jgi:glycosyltransferase involved in cell wall biosynthesis